MSDGLATLTVSSLDELCGLCQYGEVLTDSSRTELFPAPVGPITLSDCIFERYPLPSKRKTHTMILASRGILDRGGMVK
jgi:hypothetical protein